MSASNTIVMAVVAVALASCGPRVPRISYDNPVVREDPSRPAEVVQLPQPPPGQLRRIPPDRAPPPEPRDPRTRVDQANREARIQPARDGYINAIQVWPYSPGALYQVYTAPGRLTDIVLQEGEELVEQGVAAGDTARWVIGDTVSGEGASRRIHILVKPFRADLPINSMVINTRRRTYYLELRATPSSNMAAVSWDYPQDRLFAVQGRAAADAIPSDPSRLRFRYEITGDSPPWRPVRAFDDGSKVYIEFPVGIGQGEMPPLFVIGPDGDSQLVNYRARRNYYIVDRLFAAAELRLGADRQQVVRISRTDGR